MKSSERRGIAQRPPSLDAQSLLEWHVRISSIEITCLKSELEITRGILIFEQQQTTTTTTTTRRETHEQKRHTLVRLSCMSSRVIESSSVGCFETILVV